MTTSPTAEQQADLERIVTRIARRAADNVSGPVADLGCRLALAQESLEGQATVLAQMQKDAEAKDAELARAHQTITSLQERIQQLEQGDQQADQQP